MFNFLTAIGIYGGRKAWIALCKSWIRTLCRQSMDCTLIVYAHISIATVYIAVRLECDAYSVHVHGLYKPAS